MLLGYLWRPREHNEVEVSWRDGGRSGLSVAGCEWEKVGSLFFYFCGRGGGKNGGVVFIFLEVGWIWLG